MSDLDKVLAADAAAEAGLVTVPLRNTTVRFMDPLDWPIEVLERLRAQEIGSFIRDALVEDDRKVWDEVKPSARDLMGMFTALAEKTGVDPGESPAS